MGLLELAHIDGDQVPFAAIKGFRQRQGRFGLADAAGPDQEHYGNGPVRIFYPGP